MGGSQPEFSLGHVKLHCLFRYLSGEVEEPAGNTRLEFRGESWSGDINLG